jgi:hypothetical protein
METEPTTIPPALEIACDESGWEGTNLVAGSSDVIAYASVRLDVGTATECIRELRTRVGHRAIEYKASHVLRANRRPAVTWLLGPTGPLHGNALVHLTEKSYFVVGRVLDLFLGHSADAASAGLREDERLRRLALVLCRDGTAEFGGDRWRAFLVAANTVLRTWKPRNVREPVDAFLDLVDVLQELDGDSRVGTILDELRRARSDAYAARAELLQNRVLQPALEPLIPALAQTVRHWTQGEHGVSVVHDEQSALTVRRIEWLEQILLATDVRGVEHPRRGGFLHFRQVDSRFDPRVQIADLLAGIARRVASDELHDHGDPGLSTLVRPYVDPTSRWSDERSWKRLGSSNLVGP